MAARPDRTSGATIGSTLASLRTSDVLTALGFPIVLVGSIGPWVQSPLASASGFSGDGKITAGLAVLGMLVLTINRLGSWIAAIVALAALGTGVYEYERIHHGIHALNGIILFGRHVSLGWSVGWGVYAIIAGALIAGFSALVSATTEE